VARTAWQTTHTAAVFDRALAQVIEAAGMVTIDDRPGPAEADPSPLAPGPQEGYQPAQGA
jgi:hypothetical protein